MRPIPAISPCVILLPISTIDEVWMGSLTAKAKMSTGVVLSGPMHPDR
jgi:hypothetical protein